MEFPHRFLELFLIKNNNNKLSLSEANSIVEMRTVLVITAHRGFPPNCFHSSELLRPYYLTLAVVCTVGSCTVTMPSALVFPTTVGLALRMSGAVVAVTRCCRPPALLARLVSRKEYWVSGSKPVISFWVCFPSTSTDWPFP